MDEHIGSEEDSEVSPHAIDVVRKFKAKTPERIGSDTERKEEEIAWIG